MAFFGIDSAGQSISATTLADTIALNYATTATVSATTVKGLDGGDIISLGAQGLTSEATGTIAFNIAKGSARGSDTTGTYSGSVALIGSATYSTSFSGSWSGVASGGGRAALLAPVVSGVVTSERGARSLVASQLYGNAGNDSIAFGESLTTFSASTIGGGAGNDVIGSYTYVNSVWTQAKVATAATYKAAFIEAGGGDDTIKLDFSGVTWSANTVQGGQGNDAVNFSAVASNPDNSLFALGGGNDILSGALNDVSGTTVAGGGGNDAITLTAAGSAEGTLILGDALNNISTYDSSDAINFTAAHASGVTIQGMGGNDSIHLELTDGADNLFQLNVGDDQLAVSAIVSASTIEAGAGNDSITISATFLATSLAVLGGGADTINFLQDVTSGADVAGTVFGGLGADVFTATGAASAGGSTVGTTFGLSAFADSTLAAMDTIAIGGVGASASYVFDVVPGGLSVGSFSGANASGTNGVVTFTAGYDTNVTARAEYLSEQNTTVGTTLLFKDGSNIDYLFIQGGTDQTVVQVGTAGTATNGALTINGSKVVTVNLA